MEKQFSVLFAEISRYLSFWQVYAVSIIISLTICFSFLRYAEYEFKSTAKIEIFDKAQDSEMALPTSVTIFNRSLINLENEIGVLGSFSLNKKTVQDMKFNVRYFSEGNIKVSENHISEWQKYSNLRLLESVNNEIFFNSSYEIIKDNNALKVVKYKNNKFEKEYLFDKMTMEETKHDLPFEIEIFDDTFFKSKKTIKIFPLTKTVDFFTSKISIYQSGRDSDQLELSLIHPNKLIADEYLNTLLNLFDEDGIKDRQLEYKRTIDFVDSRSVFLSSELELIENRKKEFKENNNLSDIKVDAKLSADQIVNYDTELFKSISQLNLLDMLKSSLDTNSFDLMPVDIGITDSKLNSLINEFNVLIREREKFLVSAGLNNPYIKSIEKQINDYSDAIFMSIENFKKNLQTQVNSLKQKENEFILNYNNIPEFEKKLRSIERELEVKEALFLLLLQKREEASINFAVVKPSIKVIDSAMSQNNPVYPNKLLIIFIGTISGILLPSIILFIWFTLDNKIHTREQIIERINKIPIVGEIPVLTDPAELKSLSVAESRTILSESIRMIMVNLNFILFNNPEKNRNNLILVTSSVKGEGKTIISTNIASILTSKFDKVLLVGADLRNPQIHKFIGKDKNALGLSDYIFSKDLEWKNLIIKEKKLDILLSGTIPPNPTELLGSKKFKIFLEDVKQKYDYIVIDSAPCLLVSDTFEISKFIDTTLYVMRSNFSEMKLCDFINESVNQKKIKNANLVLNAVGSSKSYGYRYGYQYGYKYGYRYSYNYGYGYGYNTDEDN